MIMIPCRLTDTPRSAHRNGDSEENPKIPGLHAPGRKSALIVSYTDNWENRGVLYHKWLSAHGHEVRFITSNFNHFTLARRDQKDLPACGEFIKVPAYRGNLSISRGLSYCVFGIRLLSSLFTRKPDLVVATVPCNSTGFAAMLYKRLHPKTILVVDVFDLWPESLPSSVLKKVLSPVTFLWRSCRSTAIASADLTICECEKFSQKIKSQQPTSHPQTLYLMGKKSSQSAQDSIEKIPIRIAYLGSINHIIDIDGMLRLLEALAAHREVFVEIIGCGVLQTQFLEKLARAGIKHNFHGAVFDQTEKDSILSSCHFGLNMMNDQVFVGLTTKSIDYAGCGLPLLNTISGDTWTLVEQYGAGFNITDPCSAADIISTMTNESFKKMRHGVSLMYQDHFSSEALMSRLGSALGSVVPARQTPPSEGPLNRTELLS